MASENFRQRQHDGMWRFLSHTSHPPLDTRVLKVDEQSYRFNVRARKLTVLFHASAVSCARYPSLLLGFSKASGIGIDGYVHFLAGLIHLLGESLDFVRWNSAVLRTINSQDRGIELSDGGSILCEAGIIGDSVINHICRQLWLV